MNHSWNEMIIKKGSGSRFSFIVRPLAWYKCKGRSKKGYYLPGEARMVLPYLNIKKYFLKKKIQ
jgi:hypothetical protein